MILTTDEVYEYTLIRDKDKPDATIFLIKEITCAVTNRISDDTTYRDKDGLFKVKMGETKKIIISCCLVGWKNLKNKKGEDIPFSQENIMKLPPLAQTEIVNEINRISEVSEAQRKN
jgi:hypothetical protein